VLHLLTAWVKGGNEHDPLSVVRLEELLVRNGAVPSLASDTRHGAGSVVVFLQSHCDVRYDGFATLGVHTAASRAHGLVT